MRANRTIRDRWQPFAGIDLMTCALLDNPNRVGATTITTCFPARMRRAVIVGLVWGVFCGIANGVPIATTLVQMAVPWIWVAAFVAHREADNARLAALLGAITLFAANVAYFGVGLIAHSISGLPQAGGVRFALWVTVGLAIGPVAGVLGWWLTSQRGSFPAVVTLATITVAEPLALWTHIDHLDAHLAYIGVAAAGLALPVIWLRRDRRKALRALALVLVLAYPTAVALEATLIAFRQISPPMRLI